MSLFSLPITIIRTSGALDENGIWQEAFSQEMTILGTVQPITGKEYQNLPEGRKDQGAVKIYTTSDLKITDATTASIGDMVYFDGQKWEVAQKLSYSSGLIPHKKYVAYMVVESPDA